MLRAAYAVIAFLLFWWIAPLLVAALHIPVEAAVWALLHAVVASLCIGYVIWGGAPPKPWA